MMQLTRLPLVSQIPPRSSFATLPTIVQFLNDTFPPIVGNPETPPPKLAQKLLTIRQLFRVVAPWQRNTPPPSPAILFRMVQLLSVLLHEPPPYWKIFPPTVQL